MGLHIILITTLLVCQTQVFAGVILRDAEDSEICESEDCHTTANYILKWLNPEVDPCEDFYEFSCGNWKNLPKNERVNMSLGERGRIVDKFIPTLLKDPSATNGNKHFENLRNFMITCMDEETMRSLGMTPIKQLIEKAGGWPVLDADWSEEDWDFLNAEISLGGVLIDVDTIYYNEKNSSFVTYLLQLGPSSLIHSYRPNSKELLEGLKNESTKEYYDMMVDVAVTLGADKEVAEKAMLEVLEFETAFVVELRNTNYSHEKTITLKELQEEAPWIDLTQLLQTYLPESYELLPQEKMIDKKEFLRVLEKFFKQYPTETFVNYMISKAVYTLLDYVHHNIKLPPYYGFKGTNGDESMLHFCSKIVTDGSMGPAMATYLALLNTDASKAAADMTKVIIEELTKEVEEYEWMDKVTREEAAKNISEIKIDVGFPPKILDLIELDKLYEGYAIDTSNLFDAAMYDKKWKIQKDLNRLHKNITEDDPMNSDWKNYASKGLYTSAYFVDNNIVVTGPFLFLIPLFSPENPAYVNFGQAGSIVAHELIHAVDFNAAPGEEYFAMMERWGNNKTENIYNQKRQCFIDFYSSINDTKTTQLQLDGNQTHREDMADNGGLKVSLRAYRKYADQLGSPEPKLPRLQQYSAEQLFMISVANSYCEIPYKEKRIAQLHYDSHSPNEFRVIGMMMNSPDFSEIFNCDKKDPMNPPDKCEVW